MSIKPFLICPLFLFVSYGQDVFTSVDWAKFAAKAKEKVEVNLDGAMLKLAQQFLSSDDPEQARAKKVIEGLKSIRVRSFQFNKEGEYSLADVEKLRSNFTGNGWSAIVETKSNSASGDNVGVYVKSNGNSIDGIVVVAAEARELTLVHVLGTIDPSQLQALGQAGIIPKFGIPLKKNLNQNKKDD